MLATYWQHADNMLATYWQHAGNMLATYCCPEAIIMETEDPFKNCPLSSSVSPYSVLLGARLGAIRAQKCQTLALLKVVHNFIVTLSHYFKKFLSKNFC